MDYNCSTFSFQHSHGSTSAPATSPNPRPLQGPRPPSLKVQKESHKIKKPHSAAAAAAAAPAQQPLIIYDVSPTVIHASPKSFMPLVQRLTGNSSSSIAHAPPSPAARLATVEKARQAAKRPVPWSEDIGIDYQASIDGGSADDAAVHGWGGGAMGILSPKPSALPRVSPKIFSSVAEHSSLGFLHDMVSPAVAHTSRNGVDGLNFLLSSPCFTSPVAPSPAWETFFNLFPDIV